MNLNIFETMQLIDCGRFGISNASLMLNGVYVPGSIAFKTPWMFLAQTVLSTPTVTLSLGLYTRTGSTLTLVNSGSGTQVLNGNVQSWISFATSADSALAPGIYYFGVIVSFTTGVPQIFAGLGALTNTTGVNAGGYGGVFVRGCFSLSTTALPASIATSDCEKEGSSATRSSTVIPYVLISA